MPNPPRLVSPIDFRNGPSFARKADGHLFVGITRVRNLPHTYFQGYQAPFLELGGIS